MDLKAGDLVVFTDEAYAERCRVFLDMFGIEPPENCPLLVKQIYKHHPDKSSESEVICTFDDSPYRVCVSFLRHATTKEIKLSQLKNLFFS